MGLVSIVIAKIKNKQSLAISHKIRLSNLVLEFPKSKADLIKLKYENIV